MGIHAGTATYCQLSRLKSAGLGCRTYGYAGMFGQLSRAGHMESQLGRWLPATSSRSHYIYSQPKWEKRIKRKLVIRSLELDAKCIMLPIHLKMTDTMEETSTEAMVDTGATGDFIDQDFVT